MVNQYCAATAVCVHIYAPHLAFSFCLRLFSSHFDCRLYFDERRTAIIQVRCTDDCLLLCLSRLRLCGMQHIAHVRKENFVIQPSADSTTMRTTTKQTQSKRKTEWELFLRCALHFVWLIYSLVTMHRILLNASALSHSHQYVAIRFNKCIWSAKTNEIDIMVLLSIAQIINNIESFPFIFLCVFLFDLQPLHSVKWIACRLDVDMHSEIISISSFVQHFFWLVAKFMIFRQFFTTDMLNGLNANQHSQCHKVLVLFWLYNENSLMDSFQMWFWFVESIPFSWNFNSLENYSNWMLHPVAMLHNM